MRGRQACAILLIACAVVLAAGCVASDGGQAKVKPGDTVRVDYTGTLENGTVFDSSAGREPLEFVVGSNAVIPGFDVGVVGMQVGETKTIHIPVDQAYGPHREELVFVAEPAEIPGGEDLAVGDTVRITLSGGQVLPGRVTAVSPDVVIIDANHSLAGVDLTFTVTLVEIG